VLLQPLGEPLIGVQPQVLFQAPARDSDLPLLAEVGAPHALANQTLVHRASVSAPSAQEDSDARLPALR